MFDTNQAWTATVPNTVAKTGISRPSLYRLAASKQIRMVKHGHRTLVCLDSVRDYLNSLSDIEIRETPMPAPRQTDLSLLKKTRERQAKLEGNAIP
jgi:hypothetical protein